MFPKIACHCDIIHSKAVAEVQQEETDGWGGSSGSAGQFVLEISRDVQIVCSRNGKQMSIERIASSTILYLGFNSVSHCYSRFKLKRIDYIMFNTHVQCIV